MSNTTIDDVIEGAYVELVDGSIWSVKGFIHPPDGLICFPKYIPKVDGDRVKGLQRYSKVDGLSELWSLLRLKYRYFIVFSETYDKIVPTISYKMIKKVYSPLTKTLKVIQETPKLPIYRDLRDFILILSKESGVPVSRIGVSGSLLVDMSTSESDLDILIYGKDYGLKVYKALRRLHSGKIEVSSLTDECILKLYKERVKDTRMLFKVFYSLESRKILQGMFRNRMYFIRLLAYDRKITYGKVKFKGLGKVIVRAKVTDASDSIFTPCTYDIEVLEVAEGDKRALLAIKAYSMRGRFCELIWDGAEVLIQGRLEQYINLEDQETYYQISINDPGDIIIPIRRESIPLQP